MLVNRKFYKYFYLSGALRKIVSKEEFIEVKGMKLKGEIIFITVIACILNIISLR